MFSVKHLVMINFPFTKTYSGIELMSLHSKYHRNWSLLVVADFHIGTIVTSM